MLCEVRARVWRYPSDMEITDWCREAREAGLPEDTPWPFVIWGEAKNPVRVRKRGLRKKIGWETVAPGKVAKIIDSDEAEWFCLEKDLLPLP